MQNIIKEKNQEDITMRLFIKIWLAAVVVVVEILSSKPGSMLKLKIGINDHAGIFRYKIYKFW